jgi:hypothetical protein
MLIDCESCEVREIACGGCVVTTLLGGTGGGFEIDEGERRTLELLAAIPCIPAIPGIPVRASAPRDYPCAPCG